MKLAAKTDIGNVRRENQDDYCGAQYPNGTGWGLVCDGMGGVQGGKIAAKTATAAMQRYVEMKHSRLQSENIRKFLMQGMDVMNREVYNKAKAQPELEGMGTTAVCAYLLGRTAHVVHVGDSRAYLFHAGTLRQITHDHSMVQQMIDNGKITKQEAAVHPQKNLITRALGVEYSVLPEYNSCEVEPGDVLLLCTDGLSNMVPEDKLTATLGSVPFFDLPDVLIHQALLAGGQDNITALLIEIEKTETI